MKLQGAAWKGNTCLKSAFSAECQRFSFPPVKRARPKRCHTCTYRRLPPSPLYVPQSKCFCVNLGCKTGVKYEMNQLNCKTNKAHTTWQNRARSDLGEAYLVGGCMQNLWNQVNVTILLYLKTISEIISSLLFVLLTFRSATQRLVVAKTVYQVSVVKAL